MLVQFYSEGIDFKLPHPRKTSSWLKTVIKKEKIPLVAVQFIFCSDSFLLDLNQKYLNHNTLTDIVTFEYDASGGNKSSDIFISIDRVKENANTYAASFDKELHRVMVHGVLHLGGYKDKKRDEKALMRKKEEACLSLRKA